MRAPASALVASLLATSAHATETFTRDTFAPYTVNDVNAILGNHAFVQSLLAFDRAPFTVGLSTFQTRADWARADGSVYRGSLARTKALLSVGGGRPTTGTAAYAVFNIDGINAGPFPAFVQNAVEDGNLLAGSYGLVVAGGFAHRGFVGQVAYFYHNTQMDTDAEGRFTHCADQLGCADPYVRSGAPPEVAAGATHHEQAVGNTMFTFETRYGVSAGVLLAQRVVDTAGGGTEKKTGLGALRLLAEPTGLVPESVGVLGTGLTTFGRGLDYYGDDSEAIQEAVDAGEPLPEPSDRGIVEFPFTAQRIGGSGATARIVLQALPAPAFRLAEAGYFYEGDASWKVLPQVGARAKMFLRDTRFVPSADAYAGVFWVFRKDEEKSKGNGLSASLTYSYNSPDASNLVPLSDAHVFGLQTVFGNPYAMPPPSSLVQYPAGSAP